MQITLTIPAEYADTIATLAAQDGITPTQWVTRIIKDTVAPKPTAKLGRPQVNQARDAAIRAARIAGAGIKELSVEYGVHEVRIRQICAGI